jgi:predicted MFS family arabinose efflux permease
LIRCVRESAYKNCLLAVLMAILAFNLMDGLTLGLLLQSIKLSLSLSDTQLGLLSGVAFAFFYSIMGIPLARWADRGNRVTIIALTTALWSVALLLCGIAANFTQLLSVRVLVAVGEAGCMPVASSLMGDYFTREERPRAMSRYMMAAPLSCVVGFFLAGWLNECYGWRATFALLGLPGLLLAVIAWFTLREPRLVGTRPPDVDTRTSAAQPPLREIGKTLWRNATFRHLLLSYVVMTFCGNGTTQWLSTFFVRSYGIGTGELGTWFAVIYGTGGAIGVYCGGELAARYAANDERLQIKTMVWMFAALGVSTPLIFLPWHRYFAFAIIWINSICTAVTTGPLFAVIQTLVRERMRAQAVALLFLFSNLIGMGLGPLAVGGMSDLWHPRAGEQSLRYALLAMSPAFFWIAWHLWRASRTVTADIAEVSG